MKSRREHATCEVNPLLVTEPDSGLSMEVEPMEGFGRHFTFDGVIHDTSLITPERVRGFLDKCPDEIGMTKITLPSVYELGGKVIGMVIIAESHISFHADLNTGAISIDVFSCMFFNFKTALDTVEKYFPCRKVKTNFLERGLEFVRS